VNSLIQEENNVHLKKEPFCWFQAHLYEVFIIQKKYRVEDVSKKMNTSSDLLYRYIRGDKRFPLARFLDYLKATHDLDALKYLARETGMLLIPQVKSEKVSNLMIEISRILGETGNGSEKK